MSGASVNANGSVTFGDATTQTTASTYQLLSTTTVNSGSAAQVVTVATDILYGDYKSLHIEFATQTANNNGTYFTFLCYADYGIGYQQQQMVYSSIAQQSYSGSSTARSIGGRDYQVAICWQHDSTYAQQTNIPSYTGRVDIRHPPIISGIGTPWNIDYQGSTAQMGSGNVPGLATTVGTAQLAAPIIGLSDTTKFQYAFYFYNTTGYGTWRVYGTKT